jgi:G3E family GTPase
MRERERLPTTLLTGFLGSGKTTLLRRALLSPALADTAVVINEVGEIAIDHHIVNFVEGSVLELPGGCLCCAVREDLARTLRGLLERRERGAVRPFRRIAIETSGLADPGPILYTLAADPMLDAGLAPARVVTLIDAVSGAQTLDRFAEAGRQAAVADLLVISKTDLCAAGPELSGRLDALNPGAERAEGITNDPGELLFGWRAPHPNPLPAREERRFAAHSHGIDAFSIILGRAINRLDFARALGELVRARGIDLLRMKGILEFADARGCCALVQAAQHALYAPLWLDGWPDGDRRNRLVFVVHQIPRAEILHRFAAAAPVIVPPRFP